MGVSEIGENPPSHHLTESGTVITNPLALGITPLKETNPWLPLQKIPGLVMSK